MPPTAQILLTVATGALKTGLRNAADMFAAFGRTIAGAPLNVGRHVGKEIATNALRGLTYRGVDFLLEQGRELFDFNEALTRFGIAARKNGPELVDIGSSIRRVSADIGVNANEVLRGARTYVDLAGAANYSDTKMRSIAKTSQAAGADIGDVASVVYALQHNLGIKDNELEDTLGGLINMSKDGAVHFAQMGQEFVALSPTFAQFGIKGREGAIKLAAQLQLVRTGFGSASEAATGLQRIYRAIPQHATLLAKGGVDVFKPGSKKELETLDVILDRIKKSKLYENRPALIKAFGRGEAERAFQIIDGLKSEYEELIHLGERNGVVQEDLATYTQSSTGRMKVAYEGLKNAFAEALTPERVTQIVSGIEAIAQSAQGLAGVLGKVGDFFGFIYDKAREARALAQGTSDIDANNPWHLTGNKAARRQQLADTIAVPGQSANAIAARDVARQAIANDALYHTSAKELVALSGGENAPANEAGIRAALLLRRGQFTSNGQTFNYGAGAEGAKLAGQRYLDNAPIELVRKVAGADLVRAMKPTFDAMGKTITDAVTNALKGPAPTAAEQAMAIYRRNHPDVQVNIDGNPVARASSNATDRRRK